MNIETHLTNILDFKYFLLHLYIFSNGYTIIFTNKFNNQFIKKVNLMKILIR